MDPLEGMMRKACILYKGFRRAFKLIRYQVRVTFNTATETVSEGLEQVRCIGEKE